MVITKRDKNISQESQKALFGTFSGLVGTLSLMQSTQVPKSANYRLLFSVWGYISISKAITRAFLNSQRLYFTSTSSVCRNKQIILFQKLGCRSILNRL
jgi:hypothetical protein